MRRSGPRAEPYRAVMTPPRVVPFDITELNTMSDPSPHFRDETERLRCSKCGHSFLYSFGMTELDAGNRRQGDRIRAITDAHMRLCEGDAAVALAKVEQAYKAGELVLP